MDILSDVIATMRTGRPGVRRVEWHAPWGQRFPTSPGTAGFLVVLRGSCWLIPDSGSPVPLSVGDVLLCPDGDGYGLADNPSTPLADAADDVEETDLVASASVGYPTGGATTVTLCGGYEFHRNRTHPLLRDMPPRIHMPARLGRHQQVRAVVDLLGGEIDDARLGADAIIPILLDMLLLYLLRAWFEEQPAQANATGWAAALADPAIGAALNAIHRDPAHPWTVQTLANEAGLSRAAFSRRFSALTRHPPLTYLTWWRMTIAARLLQDSGATLGEVASRAGYTSEFAFANAFKRHYGVSPGKFRRRSQADV